MDHHTPTNHPMLMNEIVNGGVLGVCVTFLFNVLKKKGEVGCMFKIGGVFNRGPLETSFQASSSVHKPCGLCTVHNLD